MRRLALALALVLLAAAPAAAQGEAALSGTLLAVKARGTLLLGVRDSSIPFAFRNPGGEPVGFSVELCLGVAADVARVLNLDLLGPEAPSWQSGLRVRFVPVSAEARLPMVLSGTIDLECGSTTANAERAKTVAFSPVFFLAGTKLLVATDSGIASYRDLAGKIVVASAGTTNADVMRKLAARGSPAFTVVEAPDLQAAYATLAEGRAAAFASDDVLLAGLQATHPDGRRMRIVGDYLSFEPYALMLRKDDPAFAALVADSFARMAQEGTLRAAYGRWFTDRLPNGDTLNLPISPQLAELYRALGEPD